jgi:hypothetical protein
MSRVQKKVAQWVGALALLFCSFSYSNAQIVPGTENVQTHTIGDDGYVSIPLQFGFPFYGKIFTHSFMFDNGVVSFFDPTANIGCNPQNNYCGGQQFSATQPSIGMGSQFSYMIAPLWADIAPNPNTKYYTQGTGSYQRYMWENIHEYYSNGTRLNTFGLEIKPSGSIESMYSLVNIESSNTFIGTIGNPSLGEWTTIGYHPYGTVLNQIPNWNMPNTGANICATDPLSSSSCPGYAEAYFNQQCTISALYNPSCPGYAQAYYTQQCSANPLYDINCPGYAAAYLQYQCSINPLYSTTCEGYEQAYFKQQCDLNGLYSTKCYNYGEAYAVKEALKPKEEPVIVDAQTQTSSQPALLADPIANSVLTTTSTTASPAASPAAPVSLTPPPPAPATTAAAVKEESKNTTAPSTSEKKDEPKTARQAIQEKREAAARAKAVEEGKELANKVGEAATMEAQIAVQNVVIQAMGFTPGFDAYGKAFVPDGVGYKPFTVYNNQKNVDNARMMRGLSGASDRVHAQMVDSQYK